MPGLLTKEAWPEAPPEMRNAAAWWETMAEAGRLWRGGWARATGVQSPVAAMSALTETAICLAASPQSQANIALHALLAQWRLAAGWLTAGRAVADIEPDAADRRFRYAGWSALPFTMLARTQLVMEGFWNDAVNAIAGLDPVKARRVAFLGRFALNAVAPVDFPGTNPETIDASVESAGTNFIRGMRLLLEDAGRLAGQERLPGLEAFVPGETVAVQPGQVVYRNCLMELIQYAPATETVHPEPILIVPAWLMKFYILDLTPPESLVHELVAKGYTVFIVSWRNPQEDLRAVSFEDYRTDGVMKAIDVVSAIVSGRRIHGAGYCLGGTVLAIAAAAMARAGDDRLASLTLLASQTDFSDKGEMVLFIDDHQVALLEDLMHLQGFLDTRQMATGFYALRTNEMLFARIVERYLLGRDAAPTAIDAWLSDPTRIPEQTHADYLRHLLLDNSFARETYMAGNKMVGLANIRLPSFSVGAERDHVAPWRSIYEAAFAVDGSATFLLTGGGHNTGIVSPPGKPKASYQVCACEEARMDADAWRAATPVHDGSWWTEWEAWLERQSSPGRIAPPPMGCRPAGYPPLEPAPGRYIHDA